MYLHIVEKVDPTYARDLDHVGVSQARDLWPCSVDMAMAHSSDVDVTGDESECEDGELTQDSSTSYSAG